MVAGMAYVGPPHGAFVEAAVHVAARLGVVSSHEPVGVGVYFCDDVLLPRSRFKVCGQRVGLLGVYAAVAVVGQEHYDVFPWRERCLVQVLLHLVDYRRCFRGG